jgi:glutamate synthase domain-containing protein 2
MSLGSISLSAQKSLAMAAKKVGTLWNTGEGGLHEDLQEYADCAICGTPRRWRSRSARGPSRGSAGTCPA